MNIPLINFLFTNSKKKKFPLINQYKIKNEFSLSFDINSLKEYPIYKLFQSIDINDPKKIIKFNILNEFAVKMYIKGRLKFHQIPIFIKENLRYIEKNNLNSINKILDYNDKINYKLHAKYLT